MRIILRAHTWYIFGAVLLIVVALGLLVGVVRDKNVTYITTTVERGVVRELVSVSGVVEAKNNADLAFPVTGIVTDVLVAEGDIVEADAVLATLAARALVAERASAVADLARAKADYTELLAGPRSEARAVTSQTVDNARATLEQTIRAEAEKVANARLAYFSHDLEARSDDPDEDAPAPVVSGTYTCTESGTYTISAYSSSGPTGFSYRVAGLETDTKTGFVDAPGSFGTCGLFLQFTPGVSYNRAQYTIEIPNPRGARYVTNKNTYELALKNQANAIEAAENAVRLAERESTLSNAAARSEAIVRAEADISKAEAAIARIDAQIADRSIIAPFAGTITAVDILPGETAPTTPVITLLNEVSFEIKARIPEIDITKINLGQSTELIFDARSDEVRTGVISFISPQAEEIDGVAYFTATITLENPPTWLRAGLNADINIIVADSGETTRIPKRYLTTTGQVHTVTRLDGQTLTTVPVTPGLVGNDGWVEVTGIAVGDTLVAP